MEKKKKIIVAVTGASGSVYAEILLNRLLQMQDEIEECALIFSANGRSVWEFELGYSPLYDASHIRIVDVDNMFDAAASGSAGYDSMIVLPCSMATLAKIAGGIADNLISRAADVMLKEKRPLILVPREAPYNAIHLQNMLTLDRAGAFIMPASPFFYHKPLSINELLSPFIERILDQAGVSANVNRWTGER
jgi:flavin prenyltransferase